MTPEEINTLVGWLARKNEEARQERLRKERERDGF